MKTAAQKLFIVSFAFLFTGASFAATNAAKISLGAKDSLSLRKEVQHAITQGVAWLKKNQNTNGYWSAPENPAITALALTALKNDEDIRGEKKESAALKKGYDYLLGC